MTASSGQKYLGGVARPARDGGSAPEARPAMSARPVKHSLTLRGHRTSVSLEAEFWQEFREIARQKGLPLNVLAAEIDAERGTVMGLASAIRLYVLRHLRDG